MTSLQLQLTLGLEAQQSFTTEAATSVQVLGGASNASFFNTIDIGPELTIRFPHFLLPIKRERFARSAAPLTTITALYNFQQRPDFTRTLAKVSYGYEWQASRRGTVGFYPVEVNIIKIPQRSDAFNDYLGRANDPVLTDSYTDHLITGMRAQYVYSDQQQAARRNTFFARLNLEWAGHPLGMPLSLLSTTASDTGGTNFEQVASVYPMATCPCFPSRAVSSWEAPTDFAHGGPAPWVRARTAGHCSPSTASARYASRPTPNTASN
jgi:hypothetical protein